MLPTFYELGIVPCDLKPENILYFMTTSRVVLAHYKLTDVDLVCRLGDVVMDCTLLFCALEQLACGGADYAIGVFAVGQIVL
jgi:serine/threonine protein kinase